MMHANRSWMLLWPTVLAFSAAWAFAQNNPSPSGPSRQQDDAGSESVADAAAESKAKQNEGLWPSPKLLELMLSRWADEAAARYELDDQQKERVREGLVDRWADFLEEQRPTLQPLANEFLEMRMGMEPPHPDEVKEWSGRALPALQKVRAELRETQGEFREVLTPAQRARFEVDALKTGAGLQLAESKLQRWAEGKVKPEEMWEPTPSVRRERRKAREESPEDDRDPQEGDAESDEPDRGAGENADSTKKNSKPQTAKPVDQIGLELSAWEKFVADFIARHDLNEGQRTAALSCLKEISERAASHRDRHRAQIDALELRIESGEHSPEEFEEIRAKLNEYYGPVDAMFAELKSRLEAIPTAEQRSRAADRSEPRR